MYITDLILLLIVIFRGEKKSNKQKLSSPYSNIKSIIFNKISWLNQTNLMYNQTKHLTDLLLSTNSKWLDIHIQRIIRPYFYKYYESLQQHNSLIIIIVSKPKSWLCKTETLKWIFLIGEINFTQWESKNKL